MLVNYDFLKKYLNDEYTVKKTGYTLAKFTLKDKELILPINTRVYRERKVTQLYHAEYFKVQYKDVVDIEEISDLINKHRSWKPVFIPNSRAILNVDVHVDLHKILNSKESIRRYRKKYRLFPVNSENDEDLIEITINRHNMENFGKTTKESIEKDIYTSQLDATRRYYRLVDKNGVRKSVLELQVDSSNSLVIHFINTYYDKNDANKTERVGLNSYYCIPELAVEIAKEMGYSHVTIDFGPIFIYDYKLKIPGTHVGGNTLIFI